MSIRTSQLPSRFKVADIFSHLLRQFKKVGNESDLGHYEISGRALISLEREIIYVNHHFRLTAVYLWKMNSLKLFDSDDNQFLAACREVGVDPFDYLTAPSEARVALADLITEAGKGDQDLSIPVVEKVLEIKVPNTLKSQKHGTLKVADGFESLCAIIFEVYTGTPHPGSQARGSGFRSKEFARHLAEAVKGEKVVA